MTRNLTRLATATGAGVVLLIATACGSPHDPNSEPGAPAPPAATQAPSRDIPDRQPARTPPDGGREIPAGQVDFSRLPKGFPHMVWVAGDGTTVGAVAQEGGCGRAFAEVGEQGADKVVLTLVETRPAKPRPCTMDLRYPKVTAQLDQPLGSRTVVVQRAERKA